MNDQSTLFSRIGGWFKKTNRPGNGHDDGGDLPLSDQANNTSVVVQRSSFLRPWARRDAAIQQLQDGFTTLTDLMGGIRQNLETQNERQAELMQYLSSLPQVLEQFPESNRVQGETLKAIHQQLASQNAQHSKLADILERVAETGGQQRELIEDLAERVETVKHNDDTIATHLQSVGEAMQHVSRNSSDSSQVLQNMRDNFNSRDGQLERILHKQNTRFTTMLSIAIFLSISALVIVSILGYLLVVKK
jgi:chromosome segregation ATPase